MEGLPQEHLDDPDSLLGEIEDLHSITKEIAESISNFKALEPNVVIKHLEVTNQIIESVSNIIKEVQKQIDDITGRKLKTAFGSLLVNFGAILISRLELLKYEILEDQTDLIILNLDLEQANMILDSTRKLRINLIMKIATKQDKQKYIDALNNLRVYNDRRRGPSQPLSVIQKLEEQIIANYQKHNSPMVSPPGIEPESTS